MNNTSSSTPDTANAAGAAGRSSGEAGGQHQGLRQPADDQFVEDKLDGVDLRNRGAKLEDHLGDSRSKGVQGGYDDSIDHDADRGDRAPAGGESLRKGD